jgi:hypothetical protein
VRGAAIVVVGCAAFFAVLGPVRAVLGHDTSQRRNDALEAAIALVPPDASVSSTQRIGGPLSARRVIYSFPLIRDAEWVVVDRRDVWIPDLPTTRRGRMPKVMAAAFDRLEHDGRFQRVFNRDRVEVYQRVGPSS